MIQISEIAFSAYPVTDLARAREFYEGVLGLKPGPLHNAQWVEYELGAHTLGIGVAEGWLPSPDGGAVGLEVEDFDAAVAHVRAAGVTFRVEPFPTPVCKMAIISDPDGNSVILHKRHSH